MSKLGKFSVLSVLGSGGHTTEMLKMVEGLDSKHYSKTFVHANTDTMSARKLLALSSKDFQVRLSFLNNTACHSYLLILQIRQIPRAREVGQSWFSSLFFTIWAFLHSIPVVFKCQPELVLVNGPGTCVPIVLVSKLLSFIKLCPPVKIIFVESVCRVKSLSLSVKLLWYFLDEVIVQWPELTESHRGVKYIGHFL